MGVRGSLCEQDGVTETLHFLTDQTPPCSVAASGNPVKTVPYILLHPSEHV